MFVERQQIGVLPARVGAVSGEVEGEVALLAVGRAVPECKDGPSPLVAVVQGELVDELPGERTSPGCGYAAERQLGFHVALHGDRFPGIFQRGQPLPGGIDHGGGAGCLRRTQGCHSFRELRDVTIGR